MVERHMPPVEGTGKRDGSSPRDIPDGYVTWDEHYEAWDNYTKTFGHAVSAETIANTGGFGYHMLQEFLGHDPKTWVPRDQVKYAGWIRKDEEPEPELPEANPVLRSHIWFARDEVPICMSPDSLPENPFNFDNAEAVHCSPCLRKLHKWVAGWVNEGRKHDWIKLSGS